jgi:hypothetical protein
MPTPESGDGFGKSPVGERCHGGHGVGASLRPGVILAAFADASVRPVPVTIKPEQLWALYTIRGGEVITDP